MGAAVAGRSVECAGTSRVSESGCSVKVKIDTSLCEGHAKCMEAAPAVFEVRDDDLSHLLVESIPDDQRPMVERAVRTCPRAAISVEE